MHDLGQLRDSVVESALGITTDEPAGQFPVIGRAVADSGGRAGSHHPSVLHAQNPSNRGPGRVAHEGRLGGRPEACWLTTPPGERYHRTIVPA